MDKRTSILPTLLIIGMFSFVLVSALLTNYYRADLSDLFNDASFNTTKWTNTSTLGLPGTCSSNTYVTYGETTYYRLYAKAGSDGSNNCNAKGFTWMNTSLLTTPFKKYDIYFNYTSSEYVDPQGGNGETGIGVFNGNKTYTELFKAGRYEAPGTTTTSRAFHIEVLNYNESAAIYYMNNTLITVIDISSYDSWNFGWWTYGQNVHSGGGGSGTIDSYNLTTLESDIPLIEQSQSYTATAYETQTDTISSTILWDNSSYTNVNAVLYYEGIEYQVSKTLNGNLATFSTTFDLPSVTVDEVYSFYWVYTLSGGGNPQYTGSTFTQNVNNTIFIECNGTYTDAYINFTTYEEGTLLLLNSSLQANILYWLGTGETYETFTYQNLNNNQSDYSFCFVPTTKNITVQGIIDYSYIDPVTNVSYGSRSYYLDDAELTPVEDDIPLYLLTANSSSPFTFTVVDQDGNPLNDVTVRVLRWNFGTGDFYTVQIAKTGVDGKATALVRLNDAYYKYQFIYNGILYLTTEPEIEYTTSKDIVLNLARASPYLQFYNLSYDLSYDNETQVFEYVWAEPSGRIATACLRIFNLGDDEVTSLECLSSTSGSLAYQITANGTYIADAIIILSSEYDSVEYIVDTITITIGKPERFTTMAGHGYVAGLLTIGTLAFIGVAVGSIFLAIVLILVGILVCWILGWIYFSPTVMFSFIGLGIVIMFLARRKSQ